MANLLSTTAIITTPVISSIFESVLVRVVALAMLASDCWTMLFGTHHAAHHVSEHHTTKQLLVSFGKVSHNC